MVAKPTILLADEPNCNLDSKTTLCVMRLFQESKEEKVTTMIVTHEPDVASYCKCIVELWDGAILRGEQVLERSFADRIQVGGAA